MNSAFDDAMQIADDGLFATFGVPATAQRGTNPSVAVTVVVERAQATFGEYGQVIGRADHIRLRNREFVAKRGDVLVIDSVTREVDAALDDDGLVNTAVLRG